MSFNVQTRDELETGKFPCITVTRDKNTGSTHSLTRGQLVKYSANKVVAYGSSDSGDIFGIVAHDVGSSDAAVIVYIAGSFNLKSVTATGRTAAQIKTLLLTTRFDDLRKLNLYFEETQNMTETL